MRKHKRFFSFILAALMVVSLLLSFEPSTVKADDGNGYNPYPVPTRVIEYGSEGDDVKWVQKCLCNMGYLSYYDIDGFCNGNTVRAIKQFQIDAGLYDEGKADLTTVDALLHLSGYTGPGTAEPKGTTVYNGTDYSRVYDYNYYIYRYADLRKAFGSDDKAAIRHFVTYGMKEGRQAKEDFDVRSYKNANQDLRIAFGNDLKKYYIHFINYGYREKRKTTDVSTVLNPVTIYNGKDYSRIYDYNYYINKYADIKKTFGNDDIAVLKHFITYGMREGRQAKASFDVKSYKNRYQDLRIAYGNNLPNYYEHYLKWGYREGRTASGDNSVRNPVTVLNGVDYSRVYDYYYYVNKYADIRRVFGNDDIAVLKHFVTYGMREGRQAKETFDQKAYKNRYKDLRLAYGNDNKAYYMHYIIYGYREGRSGTGK